MYVEFIVHSSIMQNMRNSGISDSDDAAAASSEKPAYNKLRYIRAALFFKAFLQKNIIAIAILNLLPLHFEDQ